MPVFTPPTYSDHGDDVLFGRFGVRVGESVVKVDGAFVTQTSPWLGDLRPDLDNPASDLIEGVDWFQGGRTYWVDDTTAAALAAAGYTVAATGGYGDAGYGSGGYGG